VTELDTPPWDTGTPSFTAASLAKLKHSGLDAEYALSKRVVPVASVDDLGTEFTWSQYLCPVPGMLFHWEHPTTGALIPQYRPDNPVTYPDGEPGPKYMFPEGQHQGLGLIRNSEASNPRIAIVEGTLQGLSFARYAPADVTVYAIAGCWGWSQGEGDTHTPTPALSVVDGRDVVIFVDADAGTNSDVWDGASELARACITYGAAMVGFGRVPVRGTNGVDDFLGSVDEVKRAGVVEKLMVQVAQKPADRKPQAKRKKLGGDPLSQDMPPTDDTFLGTTWADQHLNEFRVISTDKAWMSYRDGRWSVDGAELSVGHSMLEFMSEASQPLQAAAARTKAGDPEEHEKFRRAVDAILSTRKRQAVQSSAMVYRPIHVLRDKLDQHPTKWCAANGVLDLETMRMYPHDPELLLTTGSDVPYVEGAPSERFDRFMTEVLPDAEVRAFVMRVFAMAMWGDIREQILPVFIGDGRNGKGVLIKIMQAVFGSHAQAINAKVLLKRKFDAHEVEIAQLAGKRLAVAEETGQNSEWDVARINDWTGNVRLSGRFMHGNPFNFEPSHTLVMVTNHRPNVGQGETAFWARYKEVPFTQSFEGREDPHLARTILDNELPGVLNRLIEAGREYLAAGNLMEPNAVTMATLDAKVDADNLARYVVEHLAVTEDHELDRIANSEVFDSVGKWWSQNVRGETPPGPRTFGKLMRQALGWTADSKNPRKIGKGVDSKLTWTGVRWLNGGSSDTPLQPLSRSTVSADPPTPVAADLSEANDQGLGDPKEWSAASECGSADKSAASVQDQLEPSAGQPLGSAWSAESAVKSQGIDPGRGETVEIAPQQDRQGVSTLSPSKYSGAKETDRQTKQTDTAPSGVVVLDLETGDADLQHSHPSPREFVRLAGHSTGNGVVTDPSTDAVIDAVLSSRWVIGSNLVHFDLPVLSRIDPRVDIIELTAQGRVLDTMVTESVLNPILNDKRPNAVGRASVHFKLDEACKRYGIPGKTDDAKKLAKEHGGFDKIPLDVLDPYLRGDVEASRGLARVLMSMMKQAPPSLQAYVMREHRVHALGSTMGIIGTQVDQDLLQRRYWAGAERKSRMTKKLIAKYQIPTVKADGKPADSPAATKEGKAALLRAFESLGVPERVLARTKPSKAHPEGQIAFGGDIMRELAERCEQLHHINAVEIGLLCDTIADIAGVRTVYGTALDALCSDGRVHPKVVTFQSSGRWSTTNPGLTVFGKRKGKVIERAVFTATGPNAWESESYLFAIDLSQIDARSVAVLSQDHAYMDIFGIDPETGQPRDSHAEVALAVWGDKAMRERAKPISHGWYYNMGRAKLADTAGSQQVADEFHAAMERNFPRLVAWKNEMVELASTGELMDNGLGRLMKPDPDRAYNQGPALAGQGLARDLMMECLLRLRPELQRMLRIQVHDEAIFEIPKENAEDIRREIEAAFNFEWAPPSMPGARPIQILADAGHFAYRWSECY
jgi:P4 family phage/plasmid primase-like protien